MVYNMYIYIIYNETNNNIYNEKYTKICKWYIYIYMRFILCNSHL